MDRGHDDSRGVIDGAPAIRIAYTVELAYEVRQPGADFILNIQAARTACQQVVHEQLAVEPALVGREWSDPVTAARQLRLRAGVGRLVIRHAGTVDLRHFSADPEGVPETWVCDLPPAVLPYLYPSRYCESDTLNAFAMQQFGGLRQGYARVQAICDWVQGHVGFVSGSSGGTTTAADTLASRQGVCRDFAHLMIALCRALNIPARFATGLDYGADPALGPTDFHAYVEAYVGHRWYLFDPSGTAIPMGLVRLATGRDAADCAYATIFGDVAPLTRWLTVEAVAGSDGAVRRPVRTSSALSTDG
jgi:transglutaminase-like putative cysteine protease